MTATLSLFTGPAVDPDHGKRARAFKTRRSHLMRRAKSEAVLAEVLPAHLEAGCSYHVISHGDVDALSYLAHVIKSQPLDFLLISTWVMSAPDVRLVERWVDEGRLDRVEFQFGEHMAAEYGDIYAAARRLAVFTGGEASISRNHSKVMLMRHEADGFYCVAESSANVNTNPRIEQTALHVCPDLFEFYRDFYAGIQTIHRAPG